MHGWATASLHGHAPEVQVSRWGLPLITNIFMSDPAMREDFNRAAPADDMPRFSARSRTLQPGCPVLPGPPRTRPSMGKARRNSSAQ